MRKLLIILFLSFNNKFILAECFMSPDAFDSSRDQPHMSKTILIGKIISTDTRKGPELSESKKFGAIFISEPPFPLIKIPLTTGGCNIRFGNSEKKALFISSKDFSPINSEKESIGVRGGTIFPIEDLTGRVLRSPFSPVPPYKGDILERTELPAGHPNIFWGYCQKLDTCIKVKDNCGNMIGVNDRHKSKLENYFKKKKVKCDSPKKLETVSKCVEYFCS